MKMLVLASASIYALMSDVVETVLINGKDGPIRVNKSDFEANAAKDDKDETKQDWTLNTAKKANADNDAFDPNAANQIIDVPPNVIVPPAPSAVQTNSNETQPVAPKVPSNNSLLVTKLDNKFFIVVSPSLNKVAGIGLIDDKGYKTEAEALEVLKGLPDAERIAAQAQSTAQNPA
jgi:hypothetical protein